MTRPLYLPKGISRVSSNSSSSGFIYHPPVDTTTPGTSLPPRRSRDTACNAAVADPRNITLESLDLASWNRVLAVNLSPRELRSRECVERVRGCLERYGVPATALELELTERVLVDDTPDTLEVFDELRKLGVQLSIDDFGEGYSALNYLRRLGRMCLIQLLMLRSYLRLSLP